MTPGYVGGVTVGRWFSSTLRSADTSSERIYAVGMNKKQLTTVGAVATIGGGIVTLHGITNRRWQKAHTAFTALALVVAAISFLQSHDPVSYTHLTLPTKRI